MPTTLRKSSTLTCSFRFLSGPYSFLRNSAFYPHSRNPRFILICGIRVLSSFAESAFYPHLRNPRFILARLLNPLPPVRSAFRFRVLFQHKQYSRAEQREHSVITYTERKPDSSDDDSYVFGVSQPVENKAPPTTREVKTIPAIIEKAHIRMIVDTSTTINILDSKAFNH